jgi:hypothetical protein
VTTLEAIDALEGFVSGHHFPRSRSYRIERMEDAYTCIHYTVRIFCLETPCWESVGRGRTLAEAVEKVLEKAVQR